MLAAMLIGINLTFFRANVNNSTARFSQSPSGSCLDPMQVVGRNNRWQDQRLSRGFDLEAIPLRVDHVAQRLKCRRNRHDLLL